MPFTKKILTSVVVAAAIFLIIALFAKWENILASLASFRWWTLPICLALAFGNYVVRFFKWDYYVRILDIPLPRSTSIKIFFSGLLMSVSPGKFGEVFKSFLVKGTVGTPISRSAPIVLAERFTDFVALALMSLMGLAILPASYRYLLWIAFGIIALTLVLVAWRSAALGLIALLGRIPGIAGRVDKLVHAYESVYILIAPKPLLWATAISVASWFCECLAFSLVLWGFGFPLPILRATFIYAFATIVGAIVMIAPGGTGPTEGVMVFFLTLQHLDIAMAFSVTLVIRLCTLWFAVVVGLTTLFINRGAFGNITDELGREDGVE
ncbi:MAG: lysylphosphatidylglycerol synthase transmembrane domain-containing protein [bacterium]